MCIALFHEPNGSRMTHLPVCERQPLWEGSERSKLLILSPPNGFLSRSLFHNPPHSCENECAGQFPRFHEINFIPLRFVQHPGNVQPTGACQRGMGKAESGGLGEKTRKGKGAKTGAFRLPSYLICPQDLLCNLPLGQPHIHSLPLYVLVSLLLRHAQIGDQRTFRPIHDPQILDLLL